MNYKTIRTIVDINDPLISASITETEDKLGIRRYTFSVAREFLKKGEKAFTTWFKLEHIKSIRLILDELEKELQVQEMYARQSLVDARK